MFLYRHTHITIDEKSQKLQIFDPYSATIDPMSKGLLNIDIHSQT